ncbi:hypothetical protein GCM10010261_03260 [Streptomyces pilosus]|uniref:Uncharacterized protein n=1 Tax=Streptomyces pilosus TaxID=28893 RepID=A0A918BF31_9ACTN|nr:hypothetical protein GCM10010280_08460 [Streptomyces pilosus]GGV34554.1 hypothetical protein GCM10010261_03260 [Streptomyces pilosus]
MSRTFSTSSTQREVIQAQGHSGSNQKSTGVAEDLSGMSLLVKAASPGDNAAARPGHSRLTRVRGTWQDRCCSSLSTTHEESARAR